MYTDLAAALTRAKERSGASAADDLYLTEILTLSAGVDPAGVTQYRPYYCAAKWIEQSRGDQTLTESDGTKFTGLTKIIASLFDLQAAIDKALGLIIPAGFEAISPECRTCEGESAVGGMLPRFSTRSLTSQSRP